MNIFFFILGCVLISCIFFLYFYPKVKTRIELDQNLLAQNEQLKKDIEHKNNTYKLLTQQYNLKLEQKNELESEIAYSISKLSNLDIQAKNAAENYKKAHFDKVESEIKLKEKEATIEYQNYKKSIEQSKNDAIKEYLLTLADLVKYYENKISTYTSSAEKANKKLTDLESKVAAAVAADKRKFEEENKIDYYRLIISEEDLKEISKLREIIPYLRNAEPLNKVIYKYYYEKPYNDLIGRVLGSKIYTGIYKITNLNNGMCYVGQAVNIADRWRQHIKRGLGAETPTQNKLYPAMLHDGVENFSFEMIEECERSKLNEREDYWQEYFKAKEFGYSIK